MVGKINKGRQMILGNSETNILVPKQDKAGKWFPYPSAPTIYKEKQVRAILVKRLLWGKIIKQ